MKTINELDAVALTCDLPEFGLKTGDVGTAVLVHGDGTAFEVEFPRSQTPVWERTCPGNCVSLLRRWHSLRSPTLRDQAIAN